MADEGIKARHLRAGWMHKLPMSKSTGEKWQRRFFVAKDGFLLYYATGSANSSFFDTKPKGIIPLGGCKVEPTKRGPKGANFGITVTHPDFAAGKLLILACEHEDDCALWIKAISDCSRVTMENALLGDSMIEKLRSEGTAAEAEKSATLKAMSEVALKLKLESEEKLSLLANQDAVLAAAREADERAARKEAEMAEALAEAEKRRAGIEAEIASRASALKRANEEYEAITSNLRVVSEGGLAAGPPGSLKPAPGMEARAALLMEEKQRLEKEKLALERSVRDMKLSLDSSEGARRALEQQLEGVGREEGNLAKEREMRLNLERKLAAAEASLQRLNLALRKGGVKLPDDVFADVKMLMQFFEERTEESRLDAQRIELMKGALAAKKNAILEAASGGGGGGTGRSAEALAALPPEAFLNHEVLAPKPSVSSSWGGRVSGLLGFGKGKAGGGAAPAAADGSDSD